jgi:hypothetical protein
MVRRDAAPGRALLLDVRPHFCSMKSRRTCGDYAEGLTDNEKAALYPYAAKQGMADVEEFKAMGQRGM